jgi:hypothetical protein
VKRYNREAKIDQILTFFRTYAVALFGVPTDKEICAKN